MFVTFESNATIVSFIALWTKTARGIRRSVSVYRRKILFGGYSLEMLKF